MIHRTLKSLLLLFVLLVITSRGSNAQALPAGVGPGGYIAVGIAGSGFQSDYGQTHIFGPTIYVDANIHRYLGVEAEARFLRPINNKDQSVTMNEYLIGPRYSFKPVKWVPYVKMPVGVVHMRFPYGLATGTYFVMAPGGGIEYWTRNDRIHVRVADFEYQLWPQFTYGTLKPYGVSAGISFRVF